MDWEKKLDEILENNAELRKVLEEHPERRAMYIQKMKESENAGGGGKSRNPVYCKTCIFRHGEPPFADLPEKAYCLIFEHGKTNGKPHEVYYEGAECDYYEKEKG